MIKNKKIEEFEIQERKVGERPKKQPETNPAAQQKHKSIKAPEPQLE